MNGWEKGVLQSKFMHVRYCAPIINLIVTEGLKDMHNSTSTIRNIVRCVKSSPMRLQKIKTHWSKKK